MPLAKTAPEVLTPPVAPVQATPIPEGLSGYDWQGIPLDILRHFQVELGTIPVKDLEMLKDISSWAKGRVGNEGSIGDILQEVSKIQRELGAPSKSEKSYDKTWRFIKAQRVIDEMRKRQDSLKGNSWL